LVLALCFSSNKPKLNPALINTEKLVELKPFLLKSPYLVFVITLDNQRLAHRAITNRITHLTYYLEGEEFVLEFLQGKVSSEDFLVKKVESFSDRLIFYLSAEELGLSARLEYRFSQSGACLEKTLWLKSEKPGYFFKKIYLVNWRAGTGEKPESFPGPGQPVYTTNRFFAIEYPLSYTKISGDLIQIWYQPGIKLSTEWYQSYPALIGVSEDRKAREWFFEYLDEQRHRKPEPYLLYNSWYDLRGKALASSGIVKVIDNFSSQLTARYQITLDAVVVDAGWDDFSRLWQFNSEKFPEGIEDIKAQAELASAGVGLWIGPVGGYSVRRVKRIIATLGQGYEKNLIALNPVLTGYCPAGENYHLHLKQAILNAVSQGVVYFKIDGLGTTCNVPWHNHPIGAYSQTALTDSLIEIINQAHQINPELFFNITIGSWLSPFWLKYADCVWMGGLDYGFSGPGSRREKNITYRDQRLYKLFREKNYQFPFNALMTHGIIKAKHNFSKPEPIEQFEHEVIMFFARGLSMWELYISPDILTEQEWQILAKWVKWAKDNWEILKSTEMVLGDPNKLEIYGYLHRNSQRSLLIIRNPKDKPQILNLSPETLHLDQFKSLKLLYPDSKSFSFASSVLSITLSPFEVLVIEIFN